MDFVKELKAAADAIEKGNQNHQSYTMNEDDVTLFPETKLDLRQQDNDQQRGSPDSHTEELRFDPSVHADVDRTQDEKDGHFDRHAKRIDMPSTCVKVFTTFDIFASFMSIIDVIFDYLLIAELSSKNFEGEARWLAFMATIGLMYPLLLRWEIYKQRKLGPKSTTLSFSIANPETGEIEPSKGGRDFYVFLLTMSQLFVFYIQDATTINIWWKTGMFCDGAEMAPANRTVSVCFAKASAAAKGNALCTLISALFAGISVMFATVRITRAEGVCNLGNFSLAVVVPLLMGALAIIWFIFAFDVILSGHSNITGMPSDSDCTLTGPTLSEIAGSFSNIATDVGEFELDELELDGGSGEAELELELELGLDRWGLGEASSDEGETAAIGSTIPQCTSALGITYNLFSDGVSSPQWHYWLWFFYVLGLIIAGIGAPIFYLMIALKEDPYGRVYLCKAP